jgi:MFS family permease
MLKFEGSALAHRDFRRFLTINFLWTLATQIQSVAVSWQIYNISHSPLALGYVGLSQFIPMAVFTLPAGHAADRLDRRLIMIAGFCVEVVTAGLFVMLAFIKSNVVWPFYCVLALFGFARSFVGPAAQSFVPSLVPEDRFPQAVALTSAAFQTAVIAGPAIGGAIYVLGPAVAYSVCLVLFLVVVLVISSIRTRSVTHPKETDMTGFARLMAGVSYVRSNRILMGGISLDLFAVLLGGATALLPVYARDILHVGSFGLGILRSAPALGAVVFGLLLGRMPLERNTGAVMYVCVAIFGVATIVFGLSSNFGLSLAALVVLGASDMVSVYVRTTLTQLATPDAMRGRVSAVNRLFVTASNELGEFESGLTASWFGTVPSVVIGGIGTIAVVAAWSWLFPDLRDVDRLSDVKPPSPLQ